MMQHHHPVRKKLFFISVNKFVSLITAHFTDCVLEHYILLEQVIDGYFVLCVVMHRALQEETEESLDSGSSGSLCHIA